MDTQALLGQAAQTFMANAGSSAGGLNLNTVISALGGLLQNADGQMDLAGLLSNLQGGGLASMAASWLGDGANEGISAESIMNLFGQQKLSGFAQQLGIGEGDAVSGLQAAIPDLIDKASQGGNLMDSFASPSALGGLAQNLFG